MSARTQAGENKTQAGKMCKGLGEQACVVQASENWHENKCTNMGRRKQVREIDGTHIS